MRQEANSSDQSINSSSNLHCWRVPAAYTTQQIKMRALCLHVHIRAVGADKRKSDSAYWGAKTPYGRFVEELRRPWRCGGVNKRAGEATATYRKDDYIQIDTLVHAHVAHPSFYQPYRSAACSILLYTRLVDSV